MPPKNSSAAAKPEEPANEPDKTLPAKRGGRKRAPPPDFFRPEMLQVVKSLEPIGREWRAVKRDIVAEKSASALAALRAAMPKGAKGPMGADLEAWKAALEALEDPDTGDLVSPLPSTTHIAKLLLLTVVSDISRRHLPHNSLEIREQYKLCQRIKDALYLVAQNDPDDKVATASANEAMAMYRTVCSKKNVAVERGVFLRMLGVEDVEYSESEDEDSGGGSE